MKELTQDVIDRVLDLKEHYTKGVFELHSDVKTLVSYILHLERPIDQDKLKNHLQNIIDSKEPIPLYAGDLCKIAYLVGYDNCKYTLECSETKSIFVLNEVDLENLLLANWYKYLTKPFN